MEADPETLGNGIPPAFRAIIGAGHVGDRDRRSHNPRRKLAGDGSDSF